MGKGLVKEHSITLMEVSMQGNSRMGKNMVKGHTFPMMEGSMKGNGKMGENGTEQDTIRTETSQENMLMEFYKTIP